MRIKYLKLIIIFLFMNNITIAQNFIKPFEDKINFNLLSETVLLSDSETYVKSEKSKENSKNLFYYYSNKTKKKIIKEGFEMAYPFVGKTAIAKQNNHWILIDLEGKVVYHSKNETAPNFSSFEKFILFEYGKIVYNLKTGKKENGYIYCAEPASPNYFIKELDNGKFIFIKYNFINNNQEEIFNTEFDSIHKQNFLMFEYNDNLLILKKNNKYGISLANGKEITEIKYDKAAFIGNYVMLYENKKWNYYLFENKKLNLILTSDIKCEDATYQSNVIGVFESDKKFNLLKTNGQILNMYFDYISWDGTFGISGDSVYIFDKNGDYQLYFSK